MVEGWVLGVGIGVRLVRVRVRMAACRWVRPIMSDETTDIEEHVAA